MKKCLAIAVLLLAGSLTAAQAQYSFEYGGRTITIDPDRGTVRFPASTIIPARRPSACVARRAILIVRARRRRSRQSPPRRPRPRRLPRLYLLRLNRLPLRRLRPRRPLQPPLRGASHRPRQRLLRRRMRLRQHRRGSSSRSSRPAGACSRCRASTAAATETGRRPCSFDTSACELTARRVTAEKRKARCG